MENHGNCKKNECIACTVEQCKHHSGEANYCTLDQVRIVTHEQNPTEVKCTDCASFVLKN
ncbi:MAG: DUF1540 domain-containing protein [Eubacteriales bacterium]|nr:DUF1540 domain-containing protein [Eubacteriales bacterium]